MPAKTEKKAKKQIKVQDLKPKKDAKGGVSADASVNVNTHRQTTSGRHVSRFI